MARSVSAEFEGTAINAHNMALQSIASLGFIGSLPAVAALGVLGIRFATYPDPARDQIAVLLLVSGLGEVGMAATPILLTIVVFYFFARDSEQPADSRMGDTTGRSRFTELTLARSRRLPVAIRLYGRANEAQRLPYCLEYHRVLGIDRAFIVDNGSDDGTREFLLDQPDCHVFHASGSFAEANYGMAWINALVALHGVGSWCLFVDVDELFTYPHSEKVTLPAFCRFLGSPKQRRRIFFASGYVQRMSHRRGHLSARNAVSFDSIVF